MMQEMGVHSAAPFSYPKSEEPLEGNFPKDSCNPCFYDKMGKSYSNHQLDLQITMHIDPWKA